MVSLMVKCGKTADFCRRLREIMLKSLIFDFDGLILDTESPEVVVWSEIYHEYGFQFPIDQWTQTIGGYGISNFDAAQHLQELTRGQADAASLRARYRMEADVLIHANPILPGVVELIDEAKQLGLKLAIASSSPHSWVDPHLSRLGLADRFDKVVCAEDVAPGRTKPNPDLFLKALEQLRVEKEAAVVFEDSPNGILAANRAGIFAVAVPNPLTEKLVIEGEDLRLNSLADLRLTDLLSRF